MSNPRDNEYHDPSASGSLSGVLRIWQQMHAAPVAEHSRHVAFTFSCQGEARASRVAAFLRRRLACALTMVTPGARDGRGTWLVHGSTHRQIQSLPNLEHLSSWLRKTAHSHQVELVRFALVATAA